MTDNPLLILSIVFVLIAACLFIYSILITRCKVNCNLEMLPIYLRCPCNRSEMMSDEADLPRYEELSFQDDKPKLQTQPPSYEEAIRMRQ